MTHIEVKHSIQSLERERVRRKAESGAVFTLLAIALSVLVGITALAIDLSAAQASKEQAQYFARLVALAALEEFFDATGCENDDPLAERQCRIDAGVVRAHQIAQSNKVSIAKNLSHALVLHDADMEQEGVAVIEPGIWSDKDADCGGVGTAPCFRPLTDSDPLSNAVKVTGTYYQPVSATFADAVGFQLMATTVSAVASVIPRHAVFLIDKSPSIVSNTHSDYEEHEDRFGRSTNEFGYVLNSDNTAPESEVGPWDAEAWWRLNSLYPTRGIHETDPKVHYADDYRLKYVMGDNDYSSSVHPFNPDPHASGNERYLTGHSGYWARVDLFQDTSSGYYGPEPLTTVFQGLYDGMEYFQEHHVAGDMVGVVFYDAELGWPGIFPLTEDIEGLQHYTNFHLPGGAVVTDDDGVTSYNVTSAGRETAILHGLWPRSTARTDMKLAFEEALRLFDQTDIASGIPVSRLIVHFGDGLSNCTECDPAVADCSLSCANSYENYTTSIGELEQLLASEIYPSNISIHFIVAGDHVGPHFVDIQNAESGQCFEDAEYRASDMSDPYGMVRSIAADGQEPSWRFDTMSPSNPFYDGGYNLYRMAVNTRGLFGPLRAPGADCSAPGERAPCVDGARRLTDASCRSRTEQVKEFMRTIIGHNPYNIVAVD